MLTSHSNQIFLSSSKTYRILTLNLVKHVVLIISCQFVVSVPAHAATHFHNPPSALGDLLFAERNETRKKLVPKPIVRNREMCSAFIKRRSDRNQ